MSAFVGLVWALVLTIQLHARLARGWDAQPDGYEVIEGPDAAEDVEEWRANWKIWRRMELETVRYDAYSTCNVYNQSPLQWTQRSFVQVFVMLHDRSIYDRNRHTYTVAKFVDRIEKRIGRFDSVLLWPAYPNIGIDDRNQWDWIRTMPGGVEGLRDVVRQFHARGIRVIWPYNPWDTATRNEHGLQDTVRMYTADIQMLHWLLEATGADGFNGDTMYGVPTSFFNCSDPMVAIPEGGVPSAFLSHNPISWGYFWGFNLFPPVARAKFLEPRHMVQVCARWSLNKLNELQMAFFNGAGYVVWENVWGIWNGMTAREAEATRRIFHLLRFFQDDIVGPDWKPFTQRVQHQRSQNVFATEFTSGSRALTLIVLISSSAADAVVDVELKDREISNHTYRVFDVFNGVELPKRYVGDDVGRMVVPVQIEAQGFGAIAICSSTTATSSGWQGFLAERRAMTRKSLKRYSMSRPLLQQSMESLHLQESLHSANDELVRQDRGGMVLIRGSANWHFVTEGVQIEPVKMWTPNWADFGAGVQFPWENRPWNNHSTHLHIGDFYIDKYPVTNAQYAAFLKRSRYRPAVLDRFLLHWKNRLAGNGSRWNDPWEWVVPQDCTQSPVVYISYEDAQAYAAFYRKRLVHDWEWQYVAANGEKNSTYPWGEQWQDDRSPLIVRSKEAPLPPPVGLHPAGQSIAFGVHDLVGHVWQMTDKFCDPHTCGLLLRGGSYYRPVASTHSDPNWYFPQALRSFEHNRLLMMSEGHDRSPLIGFRCATSVVDQAEYLSA